MQALPYSVDLLASVSILYVIATQYNYVFWAIANRILENLQQLLE